MSYVIKLLYYIIIIMHVFTFFANSSHARNFQLNSCYLYLSKFFYHIYLNIITIHFNCMKKTSLNEYTVTTSKSLVTTDTNKIFTVGTISESLSEDSVNYWSGMSLIRRKSNNIRTMYLCLFQKSRRIVSEKLNNIRNI